MPEFHVRAAEPGDVDAIVETALRKEPTGATLGFAGDAVATAKRDLKAGEMLDGEGGYCVWGRLMPAADSLAAGALPIGLAHGVKRRRPIKAGQGVPYAAVELADNDETWRIRREMEQRFQPVAAKAAE